MEATSHEPVLVVPGPVPASTVGMSGEYLDPLWRIPVALRPVEIDLLCSAALRRLHFIAHGGASIVTTLQSYSRLEHTLGVFALVTHFHPEDTSLRVAALLHDIGHLPLSHTFEGLAGLNHHALGMDMLRAAPLAGILRAHGIDASLVSGILAGHVDSPLMSRDGLLNLDHLDSYVRSGRAGGWLKQAPEELLERTRLEGGAISADHSAARALVDLVCMEASLHTSWDNIGPASVIRRLAGRALETGSVEPAALAGMVDAEFWSLLDGAESTRHESAMLRYEPHRLRVRVAGEASHGNAWEYALRKVYRSAPLIGVRSLRQASPELAARLDELARIPVNFTVWWD
jgi:HD superfamily phosphohydrolase